MQCYECKGYGHLARDCANRKQFDMKLAYVPNDASTGHSEPSATASHCLWKATCGLSSFDSHVILDLGASSHMTQNGSLLKDYSLLNLPEHVTLGDSYMVMVISIGTLTVKLLRHGTANLQWCFHVPDLNCMLLSIN